MSLAYFLLIASFNKFFDSHRHRRCFFVGAITSTLNPASSAGLFSRNSKTAIFSPCSNFGNFGREILSLMRKNKAYHNLRYLGLINYYRFVHYRFSPVYSLRCLSTLEVSSVSSNSKEVSTSQYDVFE